MASEIKTAVTTFSTPTGAVGTTQEITIAGLGWAPKAALFVAGPLSDTFGAITSVARFAIGLTDGTSQRLVGCLDDDGLGTTSTLRVVSTSAGLGAVSISGGLFFAADTTGDGAGSNPGPIANGWRIEVTDDHGDPLKGVVLFFGGADLSAAVGTIVPDGSVDGTVTESSLGFDPTALIFAGAGTNFTTPDETQSIVSIGVADDTIAQRCLLYGSENNAATTNMTAIVDTAAVGGQAFNGTLSWTAELTAIVTGGFTLTTRDGASGGDELAYLALDTGDRAATVFDADSPTSTASDWTVTIGSESQFAMLFSHMLQAQDSVVTTGDAGAFGVHATDETREAGVAYASEDGVGTSNANGVVDDDIIDALQDDGTRAFDLAGAAFTSTALTVPASGIATADGTTRKWFGLAIEAEAAGGGVVPVFAHHYAQMRAR